MLNKHNIQIKKFTNYKLTVGNVMMHRMQCKSLHVYFWYKHIIKVNQKLLLYLISKCALLIGQNHVT